jgi:hypothetical protein
LITKALKPRNSGILKKCLMIWSTATLDYSEGTGGGETSRTNCRFPDEDVGEQLDRLQMGLDYDVADRVVDDRLVEVLDHNSG